MDLIEPVVDIVIKVATNGIFPILACIYMYKELKEERVSHKAEVDNLAEIISKNTEVTELLIMHLKEVKK